MTNKATGTKTSKSESEAQQQTGATKAPDAAGPTELRPLQVPAALTVGDLAGLIGVGPVELIKGFMRMGYMLTVNEVVDHDTAAVIASVYGYSLSTPDEEKGPGSLVVSPDEEDAELLETRPPVVTILGHVDHGKTTLLDAIRKTNVVETEAGGITQHIGAYQVEINGTPITFLDTPGHAAFTAMRARGAQVTDIAVLVVAADDGMMPQTLEAIDHARAAEVPIVIAISKVDRPDSDLERVKRQLSEQDLLIEEWGGDVIAVPVSGLSGDGIPELLENLLVVSEVGELKANPNRDARGVVVEAHRDTSRGIMATVLVQTGTLRVGDNLVAGDTRGRVRAMFNDKGIRIPDAGPSQPVEVLGMADLPEAGDILVVAPDEKAARQMVEEHQREKELQPAATTLGDVHAKIESGEVKALNLIVKTDVQGSIEALRASLAQLNTDRTRVHLLHIASGTVTESDVLLAEASQAIIIGFNTSPEPGAQAFANQAGVEIRSYDIIYRLTEDVEKALEGLLEPEVEDIVEGQATIRAVFSIGKKMKVAGFYVNDGRMVRGSTMHVLRNGQLLFAGPIASLRHLKDDVREVANGFEGGIILDGFNDYEAGDILEAHRQQEVG